MALNRLAINLGMSLGPAMGGFLADRDFGLLFLFDAVSCLLAGGLLLFIFGFNDEVAPVERRRGRFWHPWTDKKFAAFGFCNFLVAIVFFQILGTYVLYLFEVYRLEKWNIGVLMAINTLVIVAFEMVLVRRVERYDTLRVVAIGFLLSGVGVCLIPFGRGVAWAVLSILVWTLGEMLSMPLGAAFAASRAGPDERGNYMGAYSMTYSLAFVVGPLGGMWAYHINPNYVWYVGLALTVAAATGAWILSEGASRPMKESAGALTKHDGGVPVAADIDLDTNRA